MSHPMEGYGKGKDYCPLHGFSCECGTATYAQRLHEARERKNAMEEVAALRARVAELEAKLKAVHDCLDRHRSCDPEEGCAIFSDLTEIMEKP